MGFDVGMRIGKNVDFKVRRGAPPLGVRIFLGCNKVEVFALLHADCVSLHAPVPAWWSEYDMSRVLCVPNPSIFEYYSDYNLCRSLLKLSIVWKDALSEYMVFSVFPFFETAQDRPAEKGRDYSRVPDSVDSWVIVPLKSHNVVARTKFGFLHVLWFTRFDAMLECLNFHGTGKADWCSVVHSCQPLFYFIIGGGRPSVTVPM